MRAAFSSSEVADGGAPLGGFTAASGVSPPTVASPLAAIFAAALALTSAIMRARFCSGVSSAGAALVSVVRGAAASSVALVAESSDCGLSVSSVIGSQG
jgi:hypothetical protein